MSTEKKTGGPAFPTDNEHQTGPHTYHSEGMSLRDYFAAKAMQAAWTGDDTVYPGPSLTDKAAMAKAVNEWRAEAQAKIAEWSYAMADAMLNAREQ